MNQARLDQHLTTMIRVAAFGRAAEAEEAALEQAHTRALAASPTTEKKAAVTADALKRAEDIQTRAQIHALDGEPTRIGDLPWKNVGSGAAIFKQPVVFNDGSKGSVFAIVGYVGAAPSGMRYFTRDKPAHVPLCSAPAHDADQMERSHGPNAWMTAMMNKWKKP